MKQLKSAVAIVCVLLAEENAMYVCLKSAFGLHSYKQNIAAALVYSYAKALGDRSVMRTDLEYSIITFI